MPRQLDLSSLSFEDLCTDSDSEVVECLSNDVAVIGIGVHLPQADTLEDVWNNILEGIVSYREIPEQRGKDLQDYWHQTGDSRAGKAFLNCAYMDEIDTFDPHFFKITPMEAKLMSPGQRLFLQCAWEAIEDAGYAGGQMANSSTGVYLGLIGDLDAYQYKEMIHRMHPELLPVSVAGNLGSMTVGRLAYHLNLKGPAMLIDTACSSSLVAVSVACQALNSGQCDMALAGGVRVNLSPVDDSCYKIGIESSDSYTRTFDETADGSGFGEGVVVMVLKPLDRAQRDGDNIYGVIKGSAVNQDGLSSALTAPNTVSQENVLVKAWERAGISPEQLGYLEAHGTGTKIGDIIELEAIQNAFAHYTENKQFCAIGSYKTAIGHLYECAGITGLLRAVLALKHKVLPKTLGFNLPNSKVDFSHLPVYINERNRPWKESGRPRLAAVSSFGISGTNCHLVVEEAPPQSSRAQKVAVQVFKLTAKSRKALENTALKIANYLKQPAEASFESICYSANIGRGDFGHRLMVVAEGLENLAETLESFVQGNQKQNWFYGEHQVISENQEPLKDTEITPAQKARYTAGIEQCLKDLREEGERLELLTVLAQNYVAGGDISWNQYYGSGTCQRVPLPTYGFDKQRYWLDIPETKAQAAHFTYGMTWVPVSSEAPADTPRSALLIHSGQKDSLKFKEELSRRCKFVLEAVIGKTEGVEGIAVKAELESAEDLAEQIIANNINTVVHMGAYAEACETLENPSKGVEEGLMVLFYLSKALQQRGINKDIQVVILTQNARCVCGTEPWLCPESASTIGFGKVFSQECNNICRAVDIDHKTSTKQVVAEILATSPYYHVALRANQRFVERFEKKELNALETQEVSYRNGGVYVITGGMGHIGLTFAENIAGKVQGTIVLLNRSPYPDRSRWAAIVEAGDAPQLVKKLQRIMALEASGSTVEIHAVDICNQSATEAVLEQTRKQHGAINGVIHCAGLPGSGFIVNKTTEDMEKVLGPKVQGAWVLHQATEQDALDFLVLCSSGVSVIGEIGQSDYTAANAYMDALAEYRNLQGRKTVALNWVVWENARMQQGQSAKIDGVFKTINAQEAMAAFEAVLHKKISTVLIGQMNFQSPLIHLLMSQLVFEVSEEILKALPQRNQKEFKSQTQSTAATEVRLTGGKENQYSDVERSLAQIFKHTLGFEEINIHDSFFDMGGDSILLNRMLTEIQEQYPGQVTVADLFSHTSISKLARFISGGNAVSVKTVQRSEGQYGKAEPIAIIGMACQMPLAEDVEEFWQNTLHGVDCVRQIPSQRKQDLDPYWAHISGQEAPKYMEAGYLERIDEFDYGFFNVSPREGALTDPAHRLFLQTAWHALEDAGYGGEALYGSNTGVYLGFATIIRDSYQKIIHDLDPTLISRSIVGNVSAMMPSRMSYLLNLAGPSMVIDTACSSTLVTTHMACNAIRNGECDMAIAGGVKLFVAPFEDDNMKIGIESSDGRTRAFSEGSDGAGMGEGVAAVVLKPLKKALEDGDRIHGVIRGSALNQDGASMGITAPNPEAQTKVILKAWEQAGIDPGKLAHIETHGTGTALGDPIEIQALGNAFKAYDTHKNQIAISAVKSSVGHLNECSGAVGLIKTLKILKEKVLPPTTYFSDPNTKIEFPYSPVYLNTRARKWKNTSEPMQCAISSFGFSGTNCHMVLEEAPEPMAKNLEAAHPMLTLSAKTVGAFEALIDAYIVFVKTQMVEDLNAVSYTQNCGRGHYGYRAAIIYKDQQDLLKKLQALRNDIKAGQSTAEVWWGYHKVVSQLGESARENQLTTEEKRQLETQAAQAIEALNRQPETETASTLAWIAELYVKGATLCWEDFYNHVKYPKCDVPLYPFEKHRCWLDIEARTVEEADHNLYQIAWVPAEETVPVLRREQRILVLKNQNANSQALYETLKEHQFDVLCLDVILDENGIVQYSNAEGEAGLIETVKTQGPDRIIDLSFLTMGEEALEPEAMAQAAQAVIYQYSQRMKTLMEAGQKPLEYILVTDNTHGIQGTERILKPQNAALIGFARGVDRESENLQCIAIDTDDRTDCKTVAQWLLAESLPYAMALRNGQVYRESFEAVKAEENEEPLEVSSEGIYVITGGTGGIGSEIALRLAEQGPVKIAVLGSSELPEASQWQKVLETCENKSMRQKLERLCKMKAQCAALEYHSVDFNDRKSLETVLGRLRTKYIRINGIIHGAGAPGSGFVEDMTAEKLHKVMLPKVQGTCLLDVLTREDNLQFFVLFSSVATVIEAVGQADYIAANGFMDAYAGYLQWQGKVATTINWTTWKEAGMAKDLGFVMDTAFKAIGIEEAVDGFKRAVMAPQHRVLIGQINTASKMANQLKEKGFALSAEIQKALERCKSKAASTKSVGRADTGQFVRLSGRSMGEYTQTELTLAAICKDLLGFTELDIHEHFFELGADSILIKQMYMQIQEQFDIEINITDLFEHSNIAKLGSYIEQIAKDSIKQEEPSKDSTGQELERMVESVQNGDLDIDELVNTIMSTEER